MPSLQPFRALRYNPAKVSGDEVVSPPYDVINAAERADLARRSPYNAIEIELPDPAKGESRYTHAAETLSRWEAEGILIRDDQPNLYAYRMSYPGLDGRPRHTTGVLGALRVEAPADGDVLPHERTIPKAKSDRLDLLRATQVNVSPVWGLSLADGLTELCRPEGDPVFVCHADGVTHEMWILDADRAKAVSALVATEPIVIADGHHRWETALAYSEERNAQSGPGGWDSALALIVELVQDELEIGPIHRLLTGAFTTEELLAHLAGAYEIAPAHEDLDDERLDLEVDNAGTPLLVTPEGRWWLRATAETYDRAEEDLDSARLAVGLEGLDALQMTYANNANEVMEALATGSARAAVVIRAATIASIADVAHRRRRMPPKTTFFRPKPRTGMVFRPLEG